MNYPVAHYLIAIAVYPYIVYTSPSAVINGTTVPIVNYLTGGASGLQYCNHQGKL